MQTARFMLGGIFVSFLALGCAREATPPESTPPAPVKWMEPRQMFIEEWTEIIGMTQPSPDKSARVTNAIEGYVVSVLKDAKGKPIVEGQHVKKGEVLVHLFDELALRGRDKAAAELAELEQQVEQAALNVQLAAIEVKRLEELRQKSPDLVVPTERDKARLALEKAHSEEKGVNLKVAGGRQQLRMLDEQLKQYTLRAPISGRLGRVLAVPGQTLHVGDVVAEVIDIDDAIDLLCFVPPYVLGKLKEGQAVRIEPADKTEQKTEVRGQKMEDKEEKTSGKKAGGTDGKIIYIANQSEVDTGNFVVKARLPNARLGLRSNVTRKALALTTPGKACLTLPESALMEDQEPPSVIVVDDYKLEKDKDGKDVELGTARKLNARIGTRDRVLHLVEILSVDDPEKKWQGSLESARFVIEKGQGLRTGDAIKLEQEEEEEAPAEGQKK